MQTPQTETAPDLADMQYREDEVLKRWAPSHLTDLITYRACNPNDPSPDQRIDTTIVETMPSLEKASHYGSVGMGKKAYDDFIEDLIKNKALEAVIKNRRKGRSTLITSLHVGYTWDTAFTHNGMFVASEDPKLAEDNVVIVSPLVTRMALAGISSVPEFLSWSGKVLFALPEQAKEHGIDNDIFEYRNWKAGRALIGMCVKDAAVVHRAPTGTRTEKRVLDDGTIIESVPRVSDEDAEKIIRYTPTVIGIPMHVEIGSSSAQVFQPRELEKVEHVHKLMKDMTEAASDLAKRPVVYGQPEGSRIIDEVEMADSNGQVHLQPNLVVNLREATAAG